MRQFIILVTLLTVLLCGTSWADEYDFRKSTWGMTKAAVKTTEKNKRIIIDDDPSGKLIYETEVSGQRCYLIYEFTQDKLTTTSYLFTTKHSNKNDYIADFEHIKSLLNKKYGTPLKEDKDGFWKNNLYKDDPQHWGMAVSLGHLIFRARWENEKTKIFHSLSGDNFNIKHGIIYEGKELEKLVDEKTEKETLEGF